jgi:7-carboxy-7-deazaguanine synthase
VFDAVKPVELVNWLLVSGLDRVRFQLQVHKYDWEPTMRGV